MGGTDHRGHVDELTAAYDLDRLIDLGGVVDYVVGAKPGPGVFCLASIEDPTQRHYLNLYKLGEGPLYSFYTPYHLCHFEVPTSLARAVDFGDAVIAAAGRPRVEVVTTAKTDLVAASSSGRTRRVRHLRRGRRVADSPRNACSPWVSRKVALW